MRIHGRSAGQQPTDANRPSAGHDDIILALAFSPDGARLASGGYHQVIHVWDVEA